VLHQVPDEGGRVTAEVRRGETASTVILTLPKGWRRLDDPTWRASTWGMRRMALGGMLLEPLEPEEREKAGLDGKAMGLRVRHVGQFGPHAAAKNAGVRAEDIVISYDGRTDFVREFDLIQHGVTARNVGEAVEVGILRGGKKMTLKIPMQP
jgi:hypothetical protein